MDALAIFITLIIVVWIKIGIKREERYKALHPDMAADVENTSENEEEDDDVPMHIKHPNTVLFTDSSFGF